MHVITITITNNNKIQFVVWSRVRTLWFTLCIDTNSIYLSETRKKWFKVIVKSFRTKKRYVKALLLRIVRLQIMICTVKSSTFWNKCRFCWHLRYDKAWTWLRWGLAFERAKTLLENLICSPHYLSTTYLHSFSFIYLLNPGLNLSCMI